MAAASNSNSHPSRDGDNDGASKHGGAPGVTPNGEAFHLKVPATPITCVEHPFVIQNLTTALQSLGGALRIEKFLEEPTSAKSLGLRLRPEDTLSRPILSQNIPTSDVVFRVTLPKRTGRRRPRGSNGEFVEPSDSKSERKSLGSEQKLLRSLRDNADRAVVQPIGVVWQSCRFRNLPDFQYDPGKDALMAKVRNQLLTSDFSRLRQFDIDLQANTGDEETDVGPPAAFCHLNSQFNYGYEQNPAIRTLEDGQGGRVTVNLQAMRGHITHVATLNSPTVPDRSPVPLAPRESLHPDLQKSISDLERILATRPILSRRVARNLADPATLYCQRFAWSYVGYVFKSGPWKDCLIRFGIDPRKDPACRKYQVLSFQFAEPEGMITEDQQPAQAQAEVGLTSNPQSSSQGAVDASQQSGTTVSRTESKSQPHGHTQLSESAESQANPRSKQKLVRRTAGPRSHIFDGKVAYLDGKTWQVCDITDPTLRTLLDTDDIATTPDLHGSNGWYKNGTMVVFRALMRDKIQSLMCGSIPDEETYQPFMTWPKIIEDEAKGAAAGEDAGAGGVGGSGTSTGSTPTTSTTAATPSAVPSMLRLPIGSTERQMALGFEIRVKLSAIVSEKEKEKEKEREREKAKARPKKRTREQARAGSRVPADRMDVG